MMNKKSRNNLADSIRAQIIDMPSTQPITSSRVWIEARDIMSKELVTVHPSETVVAAAQKMANNHISCVVAVDEGIIAGILTETDLLKNAASDNLSFDKTKVSEIMSAPVHTIPHDLPTLQAGTLMETLKVKRLPVEENGRLVGIVTQTDMVRALTCYGMLRDIAEIMSTEVEAVPKETKVIEAVKIMASRRISCIVVTQNDVAIGIFTEKDFLTKIVGQHKDPDRTKIREVMSSPVINAPSDYSILSASRIMEKEHVRRLVITACGKLCGILTQTDILIAVKKKLQNEENKNLSLLEKSDNSIFTLDPEGKVTYVNPAFLKLFEITNSQELIGKSFLPARFWSDPGKRDSFFENSITKQTVNRELALKSAAGREIYVNLFSTMTKNIHGHVNDNHGIIYDITAKKQIKLELEKTAKFPNEDPAPVLRLSKDGTVLYANEASNDLLALWKCRIGQTCPKHVKTIISDVLKTGENKYFDVECKEKVISLSCVPISGFGYVNLYGRDITYERTAEDQLRALNKSLSDTIEELTLSNLELQDFAHVISHDLKSPVRAIGTLANWIAADCAEKLDGDSREKMDLLVKRTERLDMMIDGILRYSGIGRTEEEKKQIDLNTLVDQICKDLYPPENINITIENTLPVLVCGKARISQVFQNLLSNAIKYMDKPQGDIRIGCSENEKYWEFYVADNGPGIEEKYFKKIFDLFETLHSCDETDQIGAGLSLVKKIVEMYEGQIWVTSRLGYGSIFFFSLPKKVFPVVNNNKHLSGIVG